MSKIKLKNLILEVLEEDERSRNDDIRLMQVIWFRFYKEHLFESPDGRWSVRIVDLHLLPREDHIKRIRAVIQNEEKRFLPTDPEVRKQRKISEDDWREFLM